MPPPVRCRPIVSLGLVAVISLIRPPSAHAPDPPLQALAPFEVFVDGLQAPHYLAINPQDGLLVSESQPGQILQVAPDHSVTVLIDRLKDPEGIAVDATGAVFFAADGQHGPEGQAHDGEILRRDPQTLGLSVVASGFKHPKGLALDLDGNLVLSAEGRQGDREEKGSLFAIGADGGIVLRIEGFTQPQGVFVGTDGSLIVAAERFERGNIALDGSLFRVDPSGQVTVMISRSLNDPFGVVRDPLHGLYVAVTETGTPGPDGGVIVKRRPEGGEVIFAQGLRRPSGLALDRHGHMYVAEAGRGRLLKFTAPPSPILNPTPPAITNQATLTLQGIAEPGDLITARGEAAPYTTVADTAGNFSLTVPLITNASNSLQLFATAAGGDGLPSAPTSVTVIHDDLPPNVALASPASGSLLRDTIPLTATASDANGIALVIFKVDGLILGVTNTPPFTTLLDTRLVAEGPHTSSVIARDKAGNEAQASVAISTDNTPPILAITGPSDGSSVPTRTPTLSITYSDITAGVNLGSFQATLDGNNISTDFSALPSGATATVTSPLARGLHTLQTSIADRAGNTASASAFFTVSPGPDFVLAAAPSIGTAIQGTGTTFSVTVVAFNNYANLVSLTVTGLPIEASAELSPNHVTSGGSSTLAVTVPGSLPPGTYPFTVTGTGVVNAALASRTIGASLAVLPKGITVLSGRIITTEEAPLPSVTIRLGTHTGLTDGAGNFIILNSPTGEQVVLIDGSTASTSLVSYPTIPVTVTIEPGQVNTLGFTPHLHAQPITRTVPLIPGQAATVTDPAVPGLVLQIPAGVTIIGWDGQPNTRIGMRVVPPDRSPLPPLEVTLGAVAGPLYMFYFGKVGGGTPSAPVPIIGPNDGGGLPGETVDLYYYDEAPDGSRPNKWAKYGTATVSIDGTQILPDTDPSTGKPYGMPRFCCGAWRSVYPPQNRPPSAAAVNLPALGQGPIGGEPVDLASGLFVLQKTDLVLPGLLPLAVTRTYRTLDSSPGPFGAGTSHSYEIFLQSLSSDALLLTLPGNSRALFARQADGRFSNAIEPGLRGATIVSAPDGSRYLGFKDGGTWTFDGAGRLIRQTDRNGNAVTVDRDGQGRVTALTEPAGRQLTLAYDGTSLRISAITDPLGRAVRYLYDGAGRLTNVTDPAGGVTTYTYDSANRLTSITDPRGITFLRNEYDGTGRVSRQVQADGGIWNFAYTLTAGIVTETRLTDPRGHTSMYRFNTSGYLTSQTDALGQTTTLERQFGTNLLLHTSDPLGRTVSLSYDANGNVTAITDPAGNVRSFTYEPTFNRLLSVSDPLGNTSRFGYDLAGNLTSLIDPLGHTTTIVYNGFGQPTSTTDPLGNTTRFGYDLAGNIITTTDPLGNESTRTYDVVSRLLTETDARGKVTAFAYDDLNRITGITDPLGGQTAFAYDPNGNLLTVTDARGSSITHEYDSMDRLSRRLEPLGHVETFAHDRNGNLASTTDRKGQTTTFNYDPLNRRMRSSFADGTIATLTYDAGGRLVLADDTADPHRPIILEYDLLDRLRTETTAMGTMAYEYDALGRRTQMTANDFNPVVYTYDAASRLRTIIQAPLNPVDIQYDALGRRTRQTLPNGVSTEYQYDAASRMTALIYRNAHGLLGDLTYTYDPAGNRTGVGGSFARTLLPEPVVIATYDAANRQLTFGDKAMTYDANGNLSSMMDPSGTTTFTWDPRNRLTALTDPETSANFMYDAFGRRGKRTVNGKQSQFQYDVVNTNAEVRDGSPVFHFRGLSVDEIFSSNDGSGARYITTDPLGSIINLTDANSSIQAEYRYGPFGQMQGTGLDGANPFQFTGRENDGIGLYYYRLRYYHPTLSRFISEDPLRPLTGADLNLYTYVSNSPLNAVDPFGLYEEDVHRDLTFCLARSAGYSSSAARRIAASNQGTDDNPQTSPLAGREARRDWHFTTEARRADLLQRALDGNLDHLGQYLHALQDSYSHDGYPPWRGHLFQGHRPDKTYNDPERANRMARDTYSRLRQYLQVTTGQSVPDHWELTREHVDRFNRARTSHEKRKNLCR